MEDAKVSWRSPGLGTVCESGPPRNRHKGALLRRSREAIWGTICTDAAINRI